MSRLRIVLSGLGLALALAGVGLNNPALVWGAIICLAVSMLLRLILRRRRPPDSSVPSDDPS